MQEVTKWVHKEGFGDITEYMFLSDDTKIYLKLRSGEIVQANPEFFYLSLIEEWVKDGSYLVLEGE